VLVGGILIGAFVVLLVAAAVGVGVVLGRRGKQ
jgi:hypothetical protein